MTVTIDRPLTRADCPSALAGHAYETPGDVLRALAEHAPGDRDAYGTGASLNAFEAKIAALLGLEAAVFMPSGTMAQQIALRIVADRSGNRRFAAHPLNHVTLHERDGFARLHALALVPLGTASTAFTLADLRALAEPVATLLVELPQRELGGELPRWDDLVAIVGAARERGMHVHLDGARLWECAPFYGKGYAEIAALFDTVYVSFYKGIGAITGAMLLGSRAFVDEAKIWQRRHGGNLYALYPYALSAESAFDERIDRMAAYAAAARRLATAFSAYPAVTLRPAVPPTNMFHVFVRADADALAQHAQAVARDHGIWTLTRLSPTVVPGTFGWEISCGDATVALSDEQIRVALDGLFAPATGRSG